ncbi:MAG: hypothetical protein QM817_00435 [Archangium sp.]
MCRLVVLVALSLSACMGLVGETPSPGDDDAGASVDASTMFELDSGPMDASVDDAAVDAGGAVDAGFDAGLVSTTDAGSRLVFAIGGQDMRHLVSFDGVTWSNDTWVAPNGEDNAFGGVAIGKGGIVMSGDPGIVRSTDGVNFSVVQMRPSRFAFHGSALAYDNDQFVLVAQDKGWRSADGITWESVTDTPGMSGHWHALAFGNGHWIALGDNVRKLSENGLDWHDPTPFAAEQFRDVAFGNGRFLAVGKEVDAGWVATSTDGQNWTTLGSIPTLYETGLSSVAFGNGVFITSTCCATLSSPDGVTWTQIANNGAGGKIVFAGDRFVSSGWRTEAKVLLPDAGRFTSTVTGNQPNPYDDAGIAPWFTGIGAGFL